MKLDNKIFLSLIVSIVAIAGICIFFAVQKEESMESKTDGMRFQEEYTSLNDVINETNKLKYPTVSLDDNNVFVYKNEEEIVKILSQKSGIIYFGFSTCPWCRSMVSTLNSVAKEAGIQEVYYLNIKDIRDVKALDENNKIITTTEGNSNYYKILELLDKYLNEYVLVGKDGKEVKTGEKRLFAPTVLTVHNGEILDIHVGTVDSQKSGYDELSEEQEKELKNIFKKMIDNFKKGTCTETGC